MIKEIYLENISIEKLADRNLQNYYLIKDENEVDSVYFCFKNSMSKGWIELVKSWEDAQAVQLKYQKNEEGNIVLECLIEVYSSDYEY